METADTIELSGNTSRKEDNIMATPDLLFPADALQDTNFDTMGIVIGGRFLYPKMGFVNTI